MDVLGIEIQYAYTVWGEFGGKYAADFKYRSLCVFTVTLAFREQMFTVGFGLSLV